MALANVGTNSLALDGFINRVLADLDGELLAKDRQAARKYLLEVWSYGDQVVGSRCHEDGKLITQPIKLLNFSAVHAHKLKRYSHCLTGLSSAKTATLGLHDVEWLSFSLSRQRHVEGHREAYVNRRLRPP